MGLLCYLATLMCLPSIYLLFAPWTSSTVIPYQKLLKLLSTASKRFRMIPLPPLLQSSKKQSEPALLFPLHLLSLLLSARFMALLVVVAILLVSDLAYVAVVVVPTFFRRLLRNVCATRSLA